MNTALRGFIAFVLALVGLPPQLLNAAVTTVSRHAMRRLFDLNIERFMLKCCFQLVLCESV